MMRSTNFAPAAQENRHTIGPVFSAQSRNKKRNIIKVRITAEDPTITA